MPGDLEVQIGALMEYHNHHRYHESTNNLTPADDYFGRRQPIKKKPTIQRRLLPAKKSGLISLIIRDQILQGNSLKVVSNVLTTNNFRETTLARIKQKEASGFQQKTILLTGATGFVGGHVATSLAAAGYRMRLSVRSFAAELPVALLQQNNVEIIETGDLANTEGLEALCEGVDAVVHTAGLAHIAQGDATANAYSRANDQVTKNLVDAATQNNVERFIHISSVAAVVPNTHKGVVDEETDLKPKTAFSVSKRAAESHVMSLTKKGILAVSLRPPLIVGYDAPGNWALLQRLAYTALPLPFSSIKNQRSYLTLDSLVRAIEHLCTIPLEPSRSGNYLLAEDSHLSLAQLIEALRNGMGISARLIPFPAAFLGALAKALGRSQQAGGLLGSLVVDNMAFCRAFDWKPTANLIAVVRQSGENYKRNTDLR